jgi:hypothetical protein
LYDLSDFSILYIRYIGAGILSTATLLGNELKRTICCSAGNLPELKELDSIVLGKLDKIDQPSLKLRRGRPDSMDGWLIGFPDESPRSQSPAAGKNRLMKTIDNHFRISESDLSYMGKRARGDSSFRGS